MVLSSFASDNYSAYSIIQIFTKLSQDCDPAANYMEIPIDLLILIINSWFDGIPVLAASKSTTWSILAPCCSNFSHSHRIEK